MKYFFLVGFLCFLSCESTTKNRVEHPEIEAIDKILNNHLESTGNKPIHNILTNFKRKNTEYQNGVGMADGRQQKVEKDFQFRIASITKTFTATLVLQLAEEGHFQIDDPIYDYLKAIDFIKMDSLHLFENTNQAKAITIRHLLQHRSGLPDFYDDMQGFIAYMEQHKKQNWTAQDLFGFYYETGLNHKTHFKSGEGFHYSDVNYLLLTKLIETVTGTEVANQYRKRIFQPLAMNDTYYEYYEKPLGIQKMAHAFYQTEDIDKSGRWSGGGFISTTKDLATFIEALFNGELFKEKATLAEMMKMPSHTKEYKYGIGLMEIMVSGNKYYGHSGFWGSHLLHCPANKETICISINQAVPSFNRMNLIKEILAIE